MDGIAQSLEQLTATLEAQLQIDEPRSEAWAALTNLVTSDGAANPAAFDRVAISIAGIAPVAEQRNPPPRGGPRRAAAPLQVELDLVLVANFTDYLIALRLIERVLTFFHLRPVMSGDMPLTLSLASLDQAQSAAIASRLGVRGQPMLCYRVRGIQIGV